MIEKVEEYEKQEGRNVQIEMGKGSIIAHIKTGASWNNPTLEIEDPVLSSFRAFDDGFHLITYKFSEFTDQRKFTIATNQIIFMSDISPGAVKAYAAIRAFIYDTPDSLGEYFNTYAERYKNIIIEMEKLALEGKVLNNYKAPTSEEVYASML